MAGWLALRSHGSCILFHRNSKLFAFYNADQVIEVETTSPVWESSALEDLNQVRQVVARQELLQQGLDPNSVEFAANRAQLARKRD